MDNFEKNRLTKLMKAAGVWDEASTWKDARIKELRKVMTRDAAHTQAWDEARKKFLGELVKDEKPRRARDDENIPDEWAGLPSQADFADEVAWVHANQAFVLKLRPGKATAFVWSAAADPPPSRGAIALMQFAAENPTKFRGDLVPKVLLNRTGEESQLDKRERVSIEEIREVLQQHEEVSGSAEIMRTLLKYAKLYFQTVKEPELEAAINKAERFLN